MLAEDMLGPYTNPYNFKYEPIACKPNYTAKKFIQTLLNCNVFHKERHRQPA
uniref:Uncharacterized protein n=1 Tax=Rhizophora mucronata TaxID=61149 RepID=A0A2P2JKW1_RHIMU